ncbi:hypothetical protein WH50_09285 [Pokkaliibacter plantistimulans]|uniref:Uncharacterized protein n=1 Tax=Pokkaliibacter plantistimulans TaxID=1635171 RepID=A0ABX5M0T0_9GAMM|nr:hypothetical protein [Pokkaliibacter plantistimulans]PXF31550.1 hypothetical protein WH50_09285 [Pokkaliibacter plantistimulans]
MWLLRGVLVLEWVLCLLLYGESLSGWRALKESYFMVWVFIIAYPLVILMFIPLLILLIWETVLFVKYKERRFLYWAALDIGITAINWQLFDIYYQSIGHP